MADNSAIEWTEATWRRACSVCQKTLSKAAFFADQSRPGGLSYVCRDCKNAAARARYKPKPRRPRGWLKPTRDGDKKQARRRINYLVEQGRIPHPRDVPCMDCCDEVFTVNYRHEYDHAQGYDGDNQLYVEAVCAKCHRNREEARRG